MSNRLLKFGIVGLLSTLVDFIVYSSWLSVVANQISLAKAAGFIGGTIVGFLLNRVWTFSDTAKLFSSGLKYATLYSLSLVANVGVNTSLLDILGATPGGDLISFAFATLASATLNFMGMKYFVFRGA